MCEDRIELSFGLHDIIKYAGLFLLRQGHLLPSLSISHACMHTRAHTHQLHYLKVGSSCSVFLSCASRACAVSVRFQSGTKNPWLIMEKKSISVNQEGELWLLQLSASSIIHFDKMSETEHVYFGCTVTTGTAIYLWRHKMPQHTAVWFLCWTWFHHYWAMTPLRWLKSDWRVTCIPDYSTWQKKKGPPTLHKDFLSVHFWRQFKHMLFTASEWQKVHERRADFTTCSLIPLSIMTLAAITAYWGLRCLSKTDADSI